MDKNKNWQVYLQSAVNAFIYSLGSSCQVVLNVFSEIKMFLYLHKEKNVLKNADFSGAGSLFTCS